MQKNSILNGKLISLMQNSLVLCDRIGDQVELYLAELVGGGTPILIIKSTFFDRNHRFSMDYIFKLLSSPRAGGSTVGGHDQGRKSRFFNTTFSFFRGEQSVFSRKIMIFRGCSPLSLHFQYLIYGRCAQSRPSAAAATISMSASSARCDFLLVFYWFSTVLRHDLGPS